MDLLTHLMTGFLVAHTAGRPQHPGSTAAVMLASIAPDVDLVPALFDPRYLLIWHRGPTHSLLLAPLIAAVVVAVGRVFAWWRWSPTYALALMAVIAHVLMDATNVYGVQLLYPLSRNWHAWDVLAFVELPLLLLLVTGVLGVVVARLLTGELSPRAHGGSQFARLILTLLLVYGAWRSVLAQRVTEWLWAFEYGGESPVRARIAPEGVNPWSWRGVVETPSAWWVVDIQAAELGGPPLNARPYYKANWSQLIWRSAEAPLVRALRNRCWFAYPRESPVGSDGALRVQWVDLLVYDPSQPLWFVEIVLDGRGMVRSERVVWGRNRTGS